MPGPDIRGEVVRRPGGTSPALDSYPGPRNSAGGAYTTVSGLKRFFHALAEGPLVSLQTFGEMIAAQVVAFAANGSRAEMEYGYGVGWAYSMAIDGSAMRAACPCQC
jgi:hypothetical protein